MREGRGTIDAYPSLPLILDLALAQLERQLERIDSLDSKTATLLAFGGVLLALLFGADFLTAEWNVVATIGTCVLLIALLILLLALRTRAYRLDPNVRSLREEYPNRPLAETTFDVVDNVIGALETNESKLAWKARFLNAGAILAFVALVIFATRALYLLERT